MNMIINTVIKIYQLKWFSNVCLIHKRKKQTTIKFADLSYTLFKIKFILPDEHGREMNTGLKKTLVVENWNATLLKNKNVFKYEYYLRGGGVDFLKNVSIPSMISIVIGMNIFFFQHLDLINNAVMRKIHS